jgi:hypothetical protein
MADPQARDDEQPWWTPRIDPAEVLGEPISEFRPGFDNLIAGVILAFLLAGVCCLGLTWLLIDTSRNWRTMPLFVEKGSCWLAFLLGSALCLGGLVTASFLLRWVRRTWTLKVRFHPGGLSVENASKVELYPWDDIAAVTETIDHERLPLAHGAASFLMPSKISYSYLVARSDGCSYLFTGNIVRDILGFARRLREETDERSIPWEVQEVWT